MMGISTLKPDGDSDQFNWIDLACFGVMLACAVCLLGRAIPILIRFALDMLGGR